MFQKYAVVTRLTTKESGNFVTFEFFDKLEHKDINYERTVGMDFKVENFKDFKVGDLYTMEVKKYN